MDYAPGLMGVFVIVFLAVNCVRLCQTQRCDDGSDMWKRLISLKNLSLGQQAFVPDIQSIVKKFDDPSWLDKVFQVVYDQVFDIDCKCKEQKRSVLMDM